MLTTASCWRECTRCFCFASLSNFAFNWATGVTIHINSCPVKCDRNVASPDLAGVKLLVAAVVGIALGGFSVWFSYRASSETVLGLIMTLLLIEGFYQGWARFEENQKAKAFRNEMRCRLDNIENVPELLRSEIE